MDIKLPATFPEGDFRAFGIAATHFLPSVISDEALFDPEEKRRQFDWSWQAVRYRYRGCAESNEAFKALLDNPSEAWRAGWGDEELLYDLERCIYHFFMSGLSIFDSFAYCLYFYGNALNPTAFPKVSTPRTITRGLTGTAFAATFPQARISQLLAGLPNDTRFMAVDAVRNIVGHRVSGRRSVRAWGTLEPDGSHTETREERWHIPGSPVTLIFDSDMLQRVFDDITGLLQEFSSAAREFAVQQQAVATTP